MQTSDQNQRGINTNMVHNSTKAVKCTGYFTELFGFQ